MNSWWTPEVFADKVSLNLYNSHLKLILSICMWTCGQRSPETFNNKSGWVSHPVCDNVSQNSVPGLRAESTVFYTVLFQRTKKRSKGPFCSISWKILDRFWLIQWNLSILIQKFTKNLLETVKCMDTTKEVKSLHYLFREKSVKYLNSSLKSGPGPDYKYIV